MQVYISRVVVRRCRLMGGLGRVESNLGYFVPEFAKNRPRSRIVCTLGPSSSSAEAIRALIEAGMSVARINTSHSTLDLHAGCIQTVREVSKSLGVSIGVLADLPGPKYRLGDLSRGAILLNAGDSLALLAEDQAPGEHCAPVSPSGLHHDVTPDDDILIADGAIRLVVRSVEGNTIHCEVRIGGRIESGKTVAVPGKTSHLPYLTADTQRALDFAVEQEVDFIGLSYVRSASDLVTAKERAADRGSTAQLIAKIELQAAVENLDEILASCDGVMVARGDLGVELPIATIPGVQKRIIRRANELGKVVITATQMLESMIASPTPTRAEVTDIANAVLDGSDAIMLSAETSIGEYPVEATKVMAEAAREAEKLLDSDAVLARRSTELERTVDEAIAYTACWTVSDIDAKVILAFTESGATAARVATFRPAVPILALFRDPAAGCRLSLRWGVTALPVPKIPNIQWMFHEGSKAALETGYAKKGDLAVAVVGMPIGIPGNTNLLRVIKLPEPAPRFERELVEDPAPGLR